MGRTHWVYRTIPEWRRWPSNSSLFPKRDVGLDIFSCLGQLAQCLYTGSAQKRTVQLYQERPMSLEDMSGEGNSHRKELQLLRIYSQDTAKQSRANSCTFQAAGSSFGSGSHGGSTGKRRHPGFMQFPEYGWPGTTRVWTVQVHLYADFLINTV